MRTTTWPPAWLEDRERLPPASRPEARVSPVESVPFPSKGSDRSDRSPPYLLVRDASGLEMAATALGNTPVVGLDLETTGLNPRTDRVRLLSLATSTIDGKTLCFLVDCFAVDSSPLWDVLGEADLVLHNAGFDLGFLVQLGFTPAGKVHDTLTLSRLLGAGLRCPHGLADCVRRELDREMDKSLQKADWSGPLTAAHLGYAARDVEVLVPLLDALRAKIALADLAGTADLERRCLPAVVWMATNGVAVDRQGWADLAARAREEAARLRDRMAELALVTPDELFVTWNWDSPVEMKRLFAALGIELENTSDEALAAIDHPLAGLLREYRAATKLTGTYGEAWLKHVAADGRVYATWNQTGSEAGRMSCSDPNMQQIPREAAYRRCVQAPPGRVLVKADYSQIELRIAAKVAQEAAMLEAYRAGEDLHTRTARQVLGLAIVTKKDRQLAKAINFGLLYGMGPKGFQLHAKSQYGLDLTEPQARDYRDGFFRTYPGLAAWHNRVKRERAPETRTLAGRRRLIPSADPARPLAERRRFEAAMDRGRLNTPVQGTGGDGLKLALALLWERRQEVPGACPVLAVHDEIVVECDQAQADVVAAWLRKAMVDAMAPLIDPVPVEVEVTVARTWGGED